MLTPFISLSGPENNQGNNRSFYYSIVNFFTPREATPLSVAEPNNTPPSYLTRVYTTLQEILYPAFPFIAGALGVVAEFVALPLEQEIAGAVLALDIILFLNAYPVLRRRDYVHLLLKACIGLVVAAVGSTALGISFGNAALLGVFLAMIWQLGRAFHQHRMAHDYLPSSVVGLMAFILPLIRANTGWASFAYLNGEAFDFPPLLPENRNFWALTFALQLPLAFFSLFAVWMLYQNRNLPSLENARSVVFDTLTKASGIQLSLYVALYAYARFIEPLAIQPNVNYLLSAFSFLGGVAGSYWVPTDELTFVPDYYRLRSNHAFARMPDNISFFNCLSLMLRNLIKEGAFITSSVLFDTMAACTSLERAIALLKIAYPRLQNFNLPLPAYLVFAAVALLGNIHHQAALKDVSVAYVPERVHVAGIRLRQALMALFYFSNIAFVLSSVYGIASLVTGESAMRFVGEGRPAVVNFTNGLIFGLAASAAVTAASMRRIVEKREVSPVVEFAVEDNAPAS
jgi:hypothetical protein